MTRKGKGWRRESARHSLAARGMRTKRTAIQQHRPIVSVDWCNTASGKRSEEILKDLCQQLEHTAAKEADTPEDIVGLLTDDIWLTAHLNELPAILHLNDEARTTLMAQIRKKYIVDGAED